MHMRLTVLPPELSLLAVQASQTHFTCMDTEFIALSSLRVKLGLQKMQKKQHSWLILTHYYKCYVTLSFHGDISKKCPKDFAKQNL